MNLKLTDEATPFYGCVPNAANPQVTAEIASLAAPWDATDKPTISSWSSLKPWLEEKAESKDRLRSQGKSPFWWDICHRLGLDPLELITPSQGSIGSCAGVSYFDRCYLFTLLHQIADGSEQQIEPVNALASWLRSKGWSRWGGQSISAVVKEGCSGGVYPASMVGTYSAGWNDKSAADAHTADAEKRQMGACLVPDSEDKFEAADLALRAGLVVEIGNSRAVAEGTEKDSNGVPVLSLSGSWSHAHVASELVIINGKVYYRWDNTHGPIYDGTQHGPTTGGVMTPDTFRRFLDSSFCDLAIVTHVESPYDLTLLPTLTPEVF